MKWNEKFRGHSDRIVRDFTFYSRLYRVQQKKVKTADKLFLVSKWQDRSAAIDTAKERVLECLKFVFHKIVENMYYDVLCLIVCTHF